MAQQKLTITRNEYYKVSRKCPKSLKLFFSYRLYCLLKLHPPLKFLREVLILAIGVFFGFWADSYREKLGERKSETEYMKSLVHDLSRDTVSVNRCITSIRERNLNIDSVLTYFTQNLNASKIPLKVVRQMMDKSTWNFQFFERTGTVDQLRYAAGFKLIRYPTIVDSIQDYYHFATQHIAAVREQFRANQDMVWQLQDELWKDSQFIRYSSLVFDSTQPSYRYNINYSTMIPINTEFLHKNLNILLRLKIHALNDIETLKNIKEHASAVITRIKARYKLSTSR
jgi:hypothetical protein